MTINALGDAMNVDRTVVIYRSHLLPLSETFIRDQAAALRRWRPILLGERALNALPLDGLKVDTLFAGSGSVSQRLQGFAYHLAGMPQPGIEARARRATPALIHAHFGFDGVAAWPVAKRLRIPLLVTLHGSDVTTKMEWYTQGHGGWRARSYPRRLVRLGSQADVHFVAVSENIKQAAVRTGLPAAKISVCRIGIAADRFVRSGLPPSQRSSRILFIGRLTEKKGCIYLIEAFERLQKSVPDAELVIAGDGDQRVQLMSRAAHLKNVHFLGSVSHDRVSELLQTSRVFCLPSVTATNGDAEGLPIVLLEAQACGVPVVTSARGGVDEGILHGQTGFAFAERDTVALARHLSEILEDDDLADRLSKNGPDYVREHHNIVKQTRLLETLYDRSVGGTTRS